MNRAMLQTAGVNKSGVQKTAQNAQHKTLSTTTRDSQERKDIIKQWK
jgi:hypothetical protein